MSRDLMTNDKQDVVVIATPEELKTIFEQGGIAEDARCITMTQLFDFLLSYYGYDPNFPPNDVY